MNSSYLTEKVWSAYSNCTSYAPMSVPSLPLALAIEGLSNVRTKPAARWSVVAVVKFLPASLPVNSACVKVGPALFWQRTKERVGVADEGETIDGLLRVKVSSCTLPLDRLNQFIPKITP